MKPIEKSLGRVKIMRVKEDEYVLTAPGKMTREDIIHLKSVLQQLIEEEHKEILEERKARGEKTYKEVRADGTIVEY